MILTRSTPGRHRAVGPTPATGSLTSRKSSRVDATSVLTAYFVFTMLVPAGAKVAALGSLGAPSSIVAVLVLIWWVWDRFHQYEPGQQQPQLVRRAAIVLIVVALVVHRHAMMEPLPTDEITPSDSALVRLLALMGIVLVASDGITDMDRFHLLVKRLTITAGAVSVLALLQFFSGQLWVDRISIPGLTPTITEDLVVRGRFLRPSGTSTHPIEFGALLGMMLPLMLTRALLAQTGRALAWGSVGAASLAVLVSISRTALICSAVALLILLPTWPRRVRRLGLVGAAVALAAASLAIPGLFGTLRGLFLGSPGDPSVASRTAGYAYAQEMFSQNPWFGRGIGTFLPKYYIFDNGYLGFLMEAGAVGVLALVALLSLAMLSAFRSARLFVRPQDRQLAWALLASVIAGSIALAFFDLFSFPQAAACLAIVLGLSGAAYRLSREPLAGPPTIPTT